MPVWLQHFLTKYHYHPTDERREAIFLLILLLSRIPLEHHLHYSKMTHTIAHNGQIARPDIYHKPSLNLSCSHTTEDTKFVYFTPNSDEPAHDILDGSEDATLYDDHDYKVSKKDLAPFLMVLNSNMPGMPQVKSGRRKRT